MGGQNMKGGWSLVWEHPSGELCNCAPGQVGINGRVLVPGSGNAVASAEDCCRACWDFGGVPGRPLDSSQGEPRQSCLCAAASSSCCILLCHARVWQHKEVSRGPCCTPC